MAQRLVAGMKVGKIEKVSLRISLLWVDERTLRLNIIEKGLKLGALSEEKMHTIQLNRT